MTLNYNSPTEEQRGYGNCQGSKKCAANEPCDASVANRIGTAMIEDITRSPMQPRVVLEGRKRLDAQLTDHAPRFRMLDYNHHLGIRYFTIAPLFVIGVQFRHTCQYFLKLTLIPTLLEVTWSGFIGSVH